MGGLVKPTCLTCTVMTCQAPVRHRGAQRRATQADEKAETRALPRVGFTACFRSPSRQTASLLVPMMTGRSADRGIPEAEAAVHR